MPVTSWVHQGHVPLNIFIRGPCQTEDTMRKDTGDARLQGGARVEQYRHHVLSYPTVQCLGRLLPRTQGKKNKCVFYRVFQINCLAKVERVHTAPSEIAFFSSGFVLMSHVGRCRPCKFRWWSRPRETLSFSMLEIINVSITCLIRWLKSPTKLVSRDANSEKEDSSEIEGLCLVLFGVVLVLHSRWTWLLFFC